MSPCLVAWEIRPFKTSVYSKKRKGERGLPCLMPLEGLIIHLGSPLIKME